MIDNTTPNPPAEAWAISIKRVRSGLGPIRIEPTKWITLGGEPQMLYAINRGREVIYNITECHATEAGAKQAAIRIARAEELYERAKLSRIMEKIEKARKAAQA